MTTQATTDSELKPATVEIRFFASPPADPFDLLAATPRLGPTGTVLFMICARHAQRHPSVTFDRPTLATQLGVAPAVLDKTLKRLVVLNVVAHVNDIYELDRWPDSGPTRK